MHLKRETDLVALVGASGVELTRHGSDWIGLCPFHDDREPSLVVTPKKNLWHCLGACQAGGSVVDWVMRAEGVGFRQAVERLRGGVPPELATTSPAAPRSKAKPKLQPPTAEDQALLSEVVTHYHERLLASDTALAYLEKRDLRDEAAIERFQLGYADRTLGTRLSAEGSAGRAKRERLKALGVLRETTGHEHLNGCLVVPILSPAGNVLNLYGRRTAKIQGPAHLYLPGPRRGVWNLSGLANSKEVILCEALLDALTFWSAGFRNVTTSYGIQGFTDEHLEAFQAYEIERVAIAYDRDEAGETAAQALAEKLALHGLAVSRVLFPKGMDANAYAARVQPAKESLALVLQSAEPLAEATEVPQQESTPPPTPTRSAAKEENPLPLLAAAPATPTAPEIPDPFEMTIGDRRWKIRGLTKNLSFEQLKVIVRVARLGTKETFFLDTVDLVSAKQRAAFLRNAASELEVKEDVLKRDLGRIHRELEAHQERLIEATLEPKQQEPPPMAREAEHSALSYLTAPGLLDRILEDFDRCGIVGEEINKLVGYLAAVSRKLEAPLAVVIQSSSAAGKSSLMDAVLALVPEEDRVQYSAMTGQSLFYMGETDLQHKILALVEEEGAERAAYALKLLQSEGELTIASTGKDPETGKLVTHEYRVEGPVMLFLTTTSIEIDEELLNRCLVLSVDESREQTRAIHRLQRERRTLDGMLGRRRRLQTVELHRNVQRLLKPLPVVNPYARELTFLDSQTRTRRDHEKYLTMIESIALLHQYQRPHKTATDRGETVEYLEVELSDIEMANRLASEVLGRSLDELPPQTRRFLSLLDRWVGGACERMEMDRADLRFTRREICEAIGWSLTQVKIHLDRLVEHEVVLVHRGGRGQSFVYELLWEDGSANERPFLGALIDTERLRQGAYDANLTASDVGVTDSEGDMTGSKRPQNGGVTEGWRGAETGKRANDHKANREPEAVSSQNALIGKSQMEIESSYAMASGTDDA